MLAVQRRTPAERFDPPCLRATWTTSVALTGPAFLRALESRLSDAGWSAAHVERMLRHGGLHVGGRPCTGDALPSDVAAGTVVVAWSFTDEPEAVALDPGHVLVDAEGVVAAAKPAWMPVQAIRASQILSLERALRRLLSCPTLVAAHRLDRETSGVVLFARDAQVARRLGMAFAAGAVEKRYHAIVSPPPEPTAWTERGFLGRAPHPSRFFFALHDEPGPRRRASETRFALRALGPGERALVHAEPVTGRTHQIRVHLAHGGTPIVGDPLYGPGGAPRANRRDERLQLHAASLRLRLGSSPDAPLVAIRAPWPPDFGEGFAP
jgi:23S rRNA pseudouridine1911/1915/1917 synthase